MNFKQFLSTLLSIGLISTQTLYAGDIKIDTTAPKSNQATLTTAPNSIPIVNIVKPNAQGLSHNKFKSFNVGKKGLILNNSNKVVKTKLSGYISFNPNLQGANAKLIINEVAGTSKTLLNGFTEVAGKSADVIVANPNGISVNGGGFINTPRVTLTTGNPLITNGLLKGFDVKKGTIFIEGEGFNTNNIDKVSLYSKALKINAKFYANRLNIITGSNQVNYDGSYTSKDKTSSGVSIDSSLLGGIYANTITLVSSDKGVGVNLPPEVFAQDSLSINANGDITLQKAVSNSLKIKSNTGSIHAQKAIQANKTLALTAKDDITAESTLLSKDININSSKGSITLKDNIKADNSLILNALNDISLSGIILSKDILLSSNLGDTVSNDIIKASNSIKINSYKDIYLDKLFSSSIDITSLQGAITLNNYTQADSINLNSKNDITLKSSLLSDLLKVKTDEGLISTENIQANDLLSLNAKKEINIKGTMLSDKINLNSQSSIHAQKAIQANKTLALTAKDDITAESTLLSKDININSSKGSITLKDNIKADNSLILNALNDISLSGIILSKDISLTSDFLGYTKGFNATGYIYINLNKTFSANAPIYANALYITTKNSIFNDAGLYAKSINITTDKNIYNNDDIYATNDIYLKSYLLENNGLINTNDLIINTINLNNKETIFTSNSMKIYTQNTLYNYENANILSLNTIHISKNTNNEKTDKVINEKAHIQTLNGNIDIYANELINKTDPLQKDTVTIGSEYFDSAWEVPTKQAAVEFEREGKTHKASGMEKATVCTDPGNDDNCWGYAQVYKNGNFTVRDSLVSSAVQYIDHYIEDCFGESLYCNKVPVYRYNINYITPDEAVSYLNEKYNKFGVTVVKIPLFDWGFHISQSNANFKFKDSISNAVRRQVNLTTKNEQVLNDPKPSYILSNGKLNIYANKITNYLSQIASNDTLSIYANELNNEGEKLYQIETLTGQYYYASGHGGWGPFRHTHYSWAPIPSKTTYTLLDNKYSLICSAKDIKGNIAAVDNIDIKSNQAPLSIQASTIKTTKQQAPNANIDTISVITPKKTTSLNPASISGEDKISNILKNITLPTNDYSLFIKTKTKNPSYLIETNPKFTIFDNFIGSGYMLKRLNFNPSLTQKRLGDNFYENRLIKEQIFAKTGKRYLSSTFSDDYTQYKALMDSALKEQKALNLTPGIQLSKKQVKALSSDIVWLEEKVVEGQKVLVPHLYIADNNNITLDDKASNIIAKDDITLKVNNLINQGAINSNSNLIITANNNILNLAGSLKADKKINLSSSNLIADISGNIKAKESLNINSKSFQSDLEVKKIKNKNNTLNEANELVSLPSNIEANNININTKDSINLIGSNLKAKDSINLKSLNKDINILSKQTTNNFYNQTATGHLQIDKTKQISSNLNAKEINLNANNINIKSSTLKANNNLQANAKESIDITSSTNRYYYDLKHELKGGFFGGGLNQQDTKDITTQIKSLLKAKHITLKAKEINQIASDIQTLQTDIRTKVLNLISKKDTNYENHFKQSSGFITQTTSSKGHIKDKEIASQIITNKLILNNKDITNKLRPIQKDIKTQIDKKLSKELNSNNILKLLSSKYKLNQKEINQARVVLRDKKWDESHKSLSALGSIIVAITASALSAGAGSSIISSATSTQISSFTAAQTIASASTQAIVTGITNQIASSVITGESFKLDTNSLIQSAISAGVLKYVDSAFVKPNTTDALRNSMNIPKYAKNAMIRGTLQGTVSKAMGGEFKNGFKAGATLSLLNDTSLQMRKYVKENFDYAGKHGEPVPDNVQSVGVNGDGVKLGGSHYRKVVEKGKIYSIPVDAPFGGSQLGARRIFKQSYPKGGIIDHAVENFAGPHDFLSSWNYENIDGKTYLKNDNFLINASSGVLLFPAAPLATSTAIQSNINLINDIRLNKHYNIDKIKDKKAKSFTEMYYEKGGMK